METYFINIKYNTVDETGRVDTDLEGYWVIATNKQTAAKTAVRHLRDRLAASWINTKVLCVLGRDQWGDSHFETIHEDDYKSSE